MSYEFAFGSQLSFFKQRGKLIFLRLGPAEPLNSALAPENTTTTTKAATSHKKKRKVWHANDFEKYEKQM